MVASLAKLKSIPLQYDEKALAKFFIQHPTECRNKTEYTCDRGSDVMILQGKIVITNNDHEAIKVLKSNANDEVVNINPYWLISENPAISAYAADWAEHFLNHMPHYENNIEIHDAIAKYLTKSPDFNSEPHCNNRPSKVDD